MAKAYLDQNLSRIRLPLKSALIYAVLGALWIFFSDRLAGMLAPTPDYFKQISLAKGWLFVLFTALLIYLLVSQVLKEVEKSQEAQRLSEEGFRTMFEMASVGLAQADPHTGRWQQVNEKLCAITGYSAQELKGMHFLDVTHPEDRPSDWQAFQLVVKGKQPAYRNEKRYVRKDGAIVWVNVNATVVEDDSGRPLYSLAVIEDITERKQAEAALEESLSLYQAILESTADGILVVDLRERVVGWNRKFKEM
jgi:PAS domain S-box-containing protein